MAHLFWWLIQSPKVSVQHIIHHRQTLVEESAGWIWRNKANSANVN